MTPVAFVSVTFRDDLNLIRLQARSIARFVDPALIDRYIIIVNHAASDPVHAQTREAVLAEMQGFKKPVLFMTQTDLIRPAKDEEGWRSQQVLKLMIARKLEGEAYILLDAKNHFVRPVGYSCFFPEGRAITRSYKPAPALQKFFDRTAAYYGLDPKMVAGDAMPATTPYILYTDWVRDLIDDIETHERCSLADFMLIKNTLVTEFFLYYCFMRAKNLPVADRYIIKKRMVVSLFTRYPEDEETTNRLIESVRDENIKVFGLHRRRIAQLTENQRRMISSLWMHNGLIATHAEVDEFLNPQGSISGGIANARLSAGNL